MSEEASTTLAAPRTILLVEDDADISDAISTVLGDDGWQVLRASNGQQALDLLGAGAHPCLILLDLMMPIMDGWQFRDAQRSRPPIADIPVVVLTAHANAREEAERMGAAGWLSKPVALADLLEAVRLGHNPRLS